MSRTILLVEDDDALRGVLGRTLRREGYEVLEAHLGAVALERLVDYERPIHMVISDASMWPDGPGALIELLADRQPDATLAFMSGYEQDELARRGLIEPSAFFFKKPFSLRELVRKIGEILDDAA